MKLFLLIVLMILSVSVSYAVEVPTCNNINLYRQKPAPPTSAKTTSNISCNSVSISKDLTETRSLLLETQKLIASEKAGAYNTALNELKYWIMPSVYILLFFVVAILLMFGWLKEKEIVSLKKKTEEDMKEFKEQIKNSVRIELDNNLVVFKDKIHTIVDTSMNSNIKNIYGLKDDIIQAVDDVVQRRLSDFELMLGVKAVQGSSASDAVVAESTALESTPMAVTNNVDPFGGEYE